MRYEAFSMQPWMLFGRTLVGLRGHLAQRTPEANDQREHGILASISVLHTVDDGPRRARGSPSPTALT